MLIFKSADPGAEVMYTLWPFDVDAFLEQYDEASMHPHIFASLHGYPGKWACTLDKGKDISMQDLLMHMEKTFGNKCDYDAMIRALIRTLASPVPPTELSAEMEAILGMEARPEPMSVVVRQEKLLEKLNLRYCVIYLDDVILCDLPG